MAALMKIRSMLAKTVNLSAKQESKVLSMAKLEPIVVDPTLLLNTDFSGITPAQKEAVLSLSGKRYQHSWQLSDARGAWWSWNSLASGIEYHYGLGDYTGDLLWDMFRIVVFPAERIQSASLSGYHLRTFATGLGAFGQSQHYNVQIAGPQRCQNRGC